MRYIGPVQHLLIKGCRYDKMSTYVKPLSYLLVEDWTGETRTRIEKRIDSFCHVDIEHTMGAVLTLRVIRKGTPRLPRVPRPL